MRKFIFIAGLCLVVGISTRLSATSYPVKREAGPWMILVQSFAGQGSGELADELCASLRRDYNVAAFVFDRGAEERQKEQERIAEVRRTMREQFRKNGLPDDAKLPPVRTHHIEEQHAVLIGGWKDQETARKALDEVRKLKPPAEKFQHKGTVSESVDGGTKLVRAEGINPFKTAFVVRNPLIPIPPDPEKGKLQNLKEYNENESFSLLKCRKPYTLLVKTYQGAVQVASANAPAGFFDRPGTNKPGQILNASAQQAHALAEALKQLKDSSGKALIPADVYVLHTEYSSYVTVGGFDRPDDASLKQIQKRVAGLQLGPVEQLMLQPQPMQIPKP